MNNERYNQIIDRTYNLYLSTDPDADNTETRMTKEEFWNLVKSDSDYAKGYGFVIVNSK